jgi:RNA polymerase sigma-70 factor, ECF subfamily
MMASRRTAPDLSAVALQSFSRGEDAGVRAVYERFAGPVYAVALSVLGDGHLAADAVQETFVRAWRGAGAGRYDPGRGLAPWLFTIARRVAIDVWRSRRHVTITAQEEDAVAQPPEFDSLWEAHQVRLAVERLPPDERDIVRLQHFVQLSHAEIAEQLRLPIGTVKSRSHRAHRRLAEWLRRLVVDGAG